MKSMRSWVFSGLLPLAGFALVLGTLVYADPHRAARPSLGLEEVLSERELPPTPTLPLPMIERLEPTSSFEENQNEPPLVNLPKPLAAVGKLTPDLGVVPAKSEIVRTNHTEWAPAAVNGFVGGATLSYLRPHYPANIAFFASVDPNGVAPRVTANEFEWDWEMANTYWLGWTHGCGLGVRGRYFTFEQHPNTQFAFLTATRANVFGDRFVPPTTIANLPNNNFSSPSLFLTAGLGLDRLAFTTGLEIDSYDAEATWMRDYGNFSMVVSGGARYVRLTQEYGALLQNTFSGAAGAGAEQQTLVARHRFEGPGPIVAWQGRYGLGRTNLAVTAAVRGALLIGIQRRDVEFTRIVADPGDLVGGNQIVAPASSSRTHSLLPITEIELGVEYGFVFKNLRPFVRGSVVNQTYFNAGNASQRDDNLSLFGAQVAVGFNF